MKRDDTVAPSEENPVTFYPVIGKLAVWDVGTSDVNHVFGDPTDISSHLKPSGPLSHILMQRVFMAIAEDGEPFAYHAVTTMRNGAMGKPTTWKPSQWLPGQSLRLVNEIAACVPGKSEPDSIKQIWYHLVHSRGFDKTPLPPCKSRDDLLWTWACYDRWSVKPWSTAIIMDDLGRWTYIEGLRRRC